jgi:Leucine Rich Repeat (LRR) protein
MQTMELPASREVSPRRRVRLQFGMRGVLIVVLLVALASAYVQRWLDHVQRQARAIAALEQFGNVSSEPVGPVWIHKIVGEKYFQRAWSAGLGGSTIDDHALQSLQTLTTLRVLELPFTNMSDAELTQLCALTRLETLNLESTGVTDEGLSRIVDASPSISWLELQGTRIGGQNTAYFERLPDLLVLNVSGTRVNDHDLRHLAGLAKLGRFQASNTVVSDAGISHLSGLRQLNSLDLMNTRVGDAGMIEVAKLENLERRLLDGTQVTDAGLRHLSALRRLQVLSLRSTRISDTGLLCLPAVFFLNVLETQVTEDGVERWLTGKGSPDSGIVWGESGARQIWTIEPTDDGPRIKKELLRLKL